MTCCMLGNVRNRLNKSSLPRAHPPQNLTVRAPPFGKLVLKQFHPKHSICCSSSHVGVTLHEVRNMFCTMCCTLHMYIHVSLHVIYSKLFNGRLYISIIVWGTSPISVQFDGVIEFDDSIQTDDAIQFESAQRASERALAVQAPISAQCAVPRYLALRTRRDSIEPSN